MLWVPCTDAQPHVLLALGACFRLMAAVIIAQPSHTPHNHLFPAAQQV